MGNHFHWSAKRTGPICAAGCTGCSYPTTVYFNRRHPTSGHLFQGRYKSFFVQGGDYLLALSRYVHLNPVRGVSLGRGTPGQRRKRLRAFKWSSYRGYAGLSAPFAFVEETMVLGELRGPKASGATALPASCGGGLGA
jgi:putative transposase